MEFLTRKGLRGQTESFVPQPSLSTDKAKPTTPLWRSAKIKRPSFPLLSSKARKSRGWVGEGDLKN